MPSPDNGAGRIAGKRVLVTGGTTGIGRAVAASLAAQGAKVFIFGRHEKELSEALEEIRVVGEVEGATADVANQEDVDRIVAEAEEAIGGLDVLVCNAGLAGEGIDDMAPDDWRYVVDTNLGGYLACTKAALPELEKEGGTIVLVGSMSADERGAGSSVYVATKAAIQAFAEALRKEVNEKGVHVSLIEPGLVGTDMVGGSAAKQERQIESEEMLRAEDVAQCVNFVLTRPSRADIVTMQIRPHRET